jgi:hypothetical protein
MRYKSLFKYFLFMSILIQISAGYSKAETLGDAMKNADQLALSRGKCLAAISLEFRYNKDNIGVEYLKFANENNKRLINVIFPQIESCAGDKMDNKEVVSQCAKKLTKKDFSFNLGYMLLASNSQEILAKKPPFFAFGTCDSKLFPQLIKP